MILPRSLQYLGLKQADVMGYSLGGSVALQTVIRHPQSVRKLVVASAGFRAERHVSGGVGGVRPDGCVDRCANEAVAVEQDVSECQLGSTLR